ncbi:MAG: DUF3040 domain-containing protein [Kineosporiaceae bacterium]
MPLSDHEQKLLAQMEQALYAEDPKFATSLRGSRRGVRSTTRVTVGVVALVLGLVTLVVGIVAFRGDLTVQLAVAVTGFVLMFAGGVVAMTGGSSRTRLAAVSSDGTRSAPRRPKARPSFIQRMEERWERRRDTGWQ